MTEDVQEVRGVVGTTHSPRRRISLVDCGSVCLVDLHADRDIKLTADECRSLARDLYRVARRIEARQP